MKCAGFKLYELLRLMTAIRLEDPRLWEEIRAFAVQKSSLEEREKTGRRMSEGEPLNTGIRIRRPAGKDVCR